MRESVDGLKQRLVGAFVILSLAIIFLPMIFDKPHQEKSAAIEVVPPKPQQRSVVISKPAPIGLPVSKAETSLKRTVVPAASVEEKRTASTNASQTNAPSSKEFVVKDVAKAESSGKQVKASSSEVYNNVWMVQLGTFSKDENAYRLRDKVRAKGVGSHTKKLASGSIRVFAGPFVTKKEALRMKRKLDSSFKLNSLVLFLDT